MPRQNKRYTTMKVVGNELAVIQKASDQEIETLAISLFFKLGRAALDKYRKIITQSYFTIPAIRTGWMAMTKMYDDGLDIDVSILQDYFLAVPSANPNAQLDEFLGLLNPDVRNDNLDSYVTVLAKKYTARQLQDMVYSVWQDVSNGTTDPDETIASLRKKIDQCAEGTILQIGKPISDSIDSHVDKLKARTKRQEELSGVDTGFFQLNRHTDGWQVGELIIVGGASSMGKTAFALNSLWGSVKANPKDYFFFSTQEMTAEAIQDRLISIITGINLLAMRSPRWLSESEWQKIEQARQEIKDSKLILEDRIMKPEEVTSTWMRAMSKYKGIKLFLLDYLQYSARNDIGRFGNDERLAIADAVTQFKSFAKRDGGLAPVICLSQIKREAIDRCRANSKDRPRKEDFDGSSNIEKDCDTALLLHRPNVYFPDEPASLAELIIEKQRNGPTNTLYLKWNERNTSFKDDKDYKKVKEEERFLEKWE